MQGTSSPESPFPEVRRRLGTVTMPDEENTGSDRDAKPLGADVAPPGDAESQGGEPGPASGVAGPSYPPAETEPDAN